MIYTIRVFCSARDKIKETLKAFLPKAKPLHETGRHHTKFKENIQYLPNQKRS